MAGEGGGRGELCVFISQREDTRCGECGTALAHPAWITLQEGKGAVCLACADLDHLAFLPAGDVALTRRSRKHSRLSAVVLKWNRRRKRYERQGILVEDAAMARAEAECAADAGEREVRRARAVLRSAELDQDYIRTFSARIRQLFPHAPPDRERIIAEHACRKYSGRVGRSAAAKDLAEDAVRLAVIAHIRHTETDYDHLMMDGVAKRDARAATMPAIQKVLANWEAR